MVDLVRKTFPSLLGSYIEVIRILRDTVMGEGEVSHIAITGESGGAGCHLRKLNLRMIFRFIIICKR